MCIRDSSLLVIVIPGPDTLLVTKNAALHSRAVGIATALGVGGGLLIWTTAAALGIAAIVRGSAEAFTVLKLVGGLYLVWLGVQLFLDSHPRAASRPAVAGRPRRPIRSRRGFRQGLLSNLANPKIAVFFTSLLPQFAGSRQSSLLPAYLVMGGVFVLLTVVWLSACSLLAARVSGMLAGSRVSALLHRATGALLVALGVRVALERR